MFIMIIYIIIITITCFITITIIIVSITIIIIIIIMITNILASGGRLCTLIGVPWRGVSFSTLSKGRFVLKQHLCKGAGSAEHAETAGYTYEGTQTTA